MGHESLHHDRTVKRRLYARRGIPKYWVRSLPDARLEVQREPDDHDADLTVTTHLLPLSVERAGVDGTSRRLPLPRHVTDTTTARHQRVVRARRARYAARDEMHAETIDTDTINVKSAVAENGPPELLVRARPWGDGPAPAPKRNESCPKAIGETKTDSPTLHRRPK